MRENGKSKYVWSAHHERDGSIGRFHEERAAAKVGQRPVLRRKRQKEAAMRRPSIGEMGASTVVLNRPAHLPQRVDGDEHAREVLLARERHVRAIHHAREGPQASLVVSHALWTRQKGVRVWGWEASSGRARTTTSAQAPATREATRRRLVRGCIDFLMRQSGRQVDPVSPQEKTARP